MICLGQLIDIEGNNSMHRRHLSSPFHLLSFDNLSLTIYVVFLFLHSRLLTAICFYLSSNVSLDSDLVSHVFSLHQHICDILFEDFLFIGWIITVKHQLERLNSRQSLKLFNGE